VQRQTPEGFLQAVVSLATGKADAEPVRLLASGFGHGVVGSYGPFARGVKATETIEE
jgi:hypothetical protein